MAIPGGFVTLVGAWTGNKAVIEPGEPRHEGPCDATIAKAMRDEFLEVRYAWSYEGEPQAGLLLLTSDGDEARAVWFDSWHNAGTWMTLSGAVTAAGAVGLRGSYPVEGSPDWGWRVALRAQAAAFEIDMYNVTPEGEEEIGVELRLRRAA